MPRERKGTIIKKRGQLYARVRFTDAQGKQCELYQRVDTKTEGREWIKGKLRELDDHGEQIIKSAKMTFSELAAIYRQNRLQPAEYVNDRKIRGRRSYLTPQGHLDTLVNHFGRKRVKAITHDDVEQYKLERLRTPVALNPDGTVKKERAIASVNRELEVLRAALRYAVRRGWLIKSPFEMGDPLISKADETQRDRVLSRDEEARLLEACLVRDAQGRQRRLHLHSLIIAALDTGMRRGELFQLRWSDVDFENRLIQVRATTTKTQRERAVPISSRLLGELQRLWEESPQDSQGLVFGITDTVKKSFASACKDAGTENLRFHDLRHTAVTRWIEAGMPPMQVMKISGHTQMGTFGRYVNVNDDALDRAREAMDEFHAENQARDTGTELIN